MTRWGRALLSLLFLALAAPAIAQPVLGDHNALATRFGTLQVTQSGFEHALTLNGAPVPLSTAPRWIINGAWGVADEPFDWVVVAWHHGGNSCGGALRILQVGAGGVRGMSSEIDDCQGRMLDLRVTRGAIEIDMGDDSDMSVSHRTFRFTGDATSVTAHTPPPTAAAGAGVEVTRWVGQHPANPFRSFDEQARFATIMTEPQAEELFALIGPARPAIRRGDWVFGAGCQPHDCNQAGGRWGLRISDGAVVAAIIRRGQAPRLFGPLARSGPFQSWLADSPL